jgi:hypothetical protein
MRLKPSDIERLTRKIIHNLNDKKLFIPKRDLPFLIQRITTILQKNVEEEAAIDAETARTMTQYETQIAGTGEYHRMYQMIKNKIAKEKKFVL